MSHSLLWVTDPYSTLDLAQDTTLRLMAEAFALGIPTFWSGTDFILNQSAPQLGVVPVDDAFLKNKNPHRKFHPQAKLSTEFSQVHFRRDPPVDEDYISLVEGILAKGVPGKNFFNPPHIITKTSEKIPPSPLLDLAPRLSVVRQASDISAAYAAFKHDHWIVSKPLNLAQSIGIQKWEMPSTETEFTRVLLDKSSALNEPILIEEYLPEINQGEVRIWFAAGKSIAALKKFPKSGDFRVLIDEGSRVEAHRLSEKEAEVARRVGAQLRLDRVALAAIDFIAEKICDYNITSPGLLVQLEKVHQQNFAKLIIEELITQYP